MDRELNQNEKRGDTVKVMFRILLIILALAAAYWGLQKVLAKKGERKDFHIVEVEHGNIRSTLTAIGLVIPYSERVINSPIATEIAEVYKSNGENVSQGELILKLDQEYTAIEYERLQDELALRKNSIAKLKLQFDKDLLDIDYQDQIKGLQLSELKAQLADQKRLHEIGGATLEELESANLQLKIAEIEKKVLENELGFRRKVNDTDKNQLQLEYDIQAKRLKELKGKLSETKVTASSDGVVTWINEDIGRTVTQGEPLVRIANLNKFKVEGTTSDRNNDKLQIGQVVEVRIGKQRLKGEVTRILPEIINNNIKFQVALENNAHEVLRPNLKTEILIITDKKENVLKAKRGSGLKGTKEQYFFKIQGDHAEKTRVTKGLVSSEYFEIISGVKKGDRLIVSETEEFDHMDSFILE